MKLVQKVSSGLGIVRARATGARIPVALRWNLLNRCPCRCTYCNLWNTPSTEPETAVVLRSLKEFARLGTTVVSFSGGEPLLRDDIGRLVDGAAEAGISPTLNTSGHGLRSRVADLRNLDVLKLSLDGPEEVHDVARGRRGAFRTAMEAAELTRSRLRKLQLATTITRHNVRHLDWVLGNAGRQQAMVAFQPLKTMYRGIRDLHEIAPDPADFAAAVRDLIAEKRRGNPWIRNSILELQRLAQWPRFQPLRCGAGRVFVMVNPDGTIVPCDRIDYPGADLPRLDSGPLADLLDRLPDPVCSGCAFCGSLELNLLYSLQKPWPLKEILRIT